MGTWGSGSLYPNGSNPLIRAPTSMQQSSRHQTAASSQHTISIAHLKDRSLEELQTLLNDEEAYNAFLHSLDKVREMDRFREEMRKESIEAAKKNLAREPEIAELHNQCAIIRSTELAPAQEKLDGLLKRVNKIQSRFSEDALLKKLQAAREQADEESEVLHKAMLGGAMDAQEFISRYRKLRVLYHMRALMLIAARTNPG